ncbi:phage tail protein, partial [Enterobacter asburiae]|uniref:phage tail protein n=2 Tax=Enterobacter asburiae TaxID=61645 RepID=UPI003C75F702
MANLPETPQWEDGIYQIEVSDPVLGGPDGISNRQAKQLASRTSYLKQKVEKSGTDLAAHIAAVDPHTQYATKASPTFTGTPTAPTPANSDNSKKLATTEFVAKALAALAGSAPETLDTLKELADALGNDPNFATTVLNKLAEKLAKDQNGADIPDPVLFVKNLGLSTVVQGDRCYLVGFASGEANQPYMMHFASQEVVKLATAESPTFTGAPLVPDALPGNYGQQAANTKFV